MGVFQFVLGVLTLVVEAYKTTKESAKEKGRRMRKRFSRSKS